MFELFQDKDRKWRWRLQSANNEILATSEAYEGGEGAARAGIAAVCEAVEDAYDTVKTTQPSRIALEARKVEG